MGSLEYSLMFLGTFCVFFSLIGSIIGELLLCLFVRLGWIKPRIVTVRHVIEEAAQ